MHSVARVNEHRMAQPDFIAPPKKRDDCVLLTGVALAMFRLLCTAVNITPECFCTIPVDCSTRNELTIEHIRRLLVSGTGVVCLYPLGIALSNVMRGFGKIGEAFMFERLALAGSDEAYTTRWENRL